MQAEKFRTLALYYLIFRAECTLLISLFLKEFYPAGGQLETLVFLALFKATEL